MGRYAVLLGFQPMNCLHTSEQGEMKSMRTLPLCAAYMSDREFQLSISSLDIYISDGTDVSFEVKRNMGARDGSQEVWVEDETDCSSAFKS